MKSWSSGFWKTTPTFLRISGRVSFRSGTSPTVTPPDVGSRCPFMWRSSVDFPAPFAPTMPTDSPWVIRKETPFSASVPSGYRKRTSLNSRR